MSDFTSNPLGYSEAEAQAQSGQMPGYGMQQPYPGYGPPPAHGMPPPHGMPPHGMPPPGYAYPPQPVPGYGYPPHGMPPHGGDQSGNIELTVEVGKDGNAKITAQQPQGQQQPYYPYPNDPRMMAQHATTIQKHWRGHQARKQMQSEEKAGRTKVHPSKGTARVILHACKGLYDTQCCMRMDPFAKFTLREHIQTSEVIDKGGQKPSWTNTPQFDFALEDGDKDIKVDLINKNLLMDDWIGELKLPVDSFRKSFVKPKKKKWLTLKRDNGRVSAGDVCLTLKYIPPFTIYLKKANDIPDVQAIGKQDPYVMFRFTGKTPMGDQGTRRSKTCRDGVTNPDWGQSFTFNVADERFADEKQAARIEDAGLQIQIMNENTFSDDAIAWAHVSYGELLRSHSSRKAPPVPLYKGAIEKQGKEPAGFLFVYLNT